MVRVASQLERPASFRFSAAARDHTLRRGDYRRNRGQHGGECYGRAGSDQHVAGGRCACRSQARRRRARANLCFARPRELRKARVLLLKLGAREQRAQRADTCVGCIAWHVREVSGSERSTGAAACRDTAGADWRFDIHAADSLHVYGLGPLGLGVTEDRRQQQHQVRDRAGGAVRTG